MNLFLTEALALICSPVNKHFGADDIAERQEHLHQFSVPKLLRQVVDEEVTALRSRNRASYNMEAFQFTHSNIESFEKKVKESQKCYLCLDMEWSGMLAEAYFRPFVHWQWLDLQYKVR